jgi:F-type H+-transporting ATPase subunit gamma
MSKTRDIKRRIRSVSNTMQLTKAMKMVSAAKMRRATDSIVAARPFAHNMRDVLRSLAARANAEAHPLLQVTGTEKVELLVVTGDKGLCGSFNTNINKTAHNFIKAEQAKGERVFDLHAVGKRGVEYFRRRDVTIHKAWIDILRQVEFATAKEIARDMMERYVTGELDAIYLVYNEFKSAISQHPVVERLLPIAPIEVEEGETTEDYIYEPGAEELLNALLNRHVEVQVYTALLESVAAEHAARMTAMDSASRNAGELIDRLTLHMNRVRQAAITTEIIEVVSGAQSLG